MSLFFLINVQDNNINACQNFFMLCLSISVDNPHGINQNEILYYDLTTLKFKFRIFSPLFLAFIGAAFDFKIHFWASTHAKWSFCLKEAYVGMMWGKMIFCLIQNFSIKALQQR